MKDPAMHIMIDIETLGLKPGSIIISIGMVWFNPVSGAILGEQYIAVDAEASERAGLTIGAGTFLWWMRQSDAARMEIHSPIEAPQLPAVALLTVTATIENWTDMHKARHLIPNRRCASGRTGRVSIWCFWKLLTPRWT